MLIGAHESIAGGLHLAFGREEADGGEALQIFTGFNTRWRIRAPDAEEASRFRSEAARFAGPVLSHTGYLVNLARPDGQRSVEALVEELVRCETLGIEATVLHPGAGLGAGLRPALARVKRALRQVLRDTAGFSTRLLLENTAGQGTTLGRTFEELGRILEGVAHPERTGVCLDTCHAFAAGYDLRTDEGLARTLEELEREVGLSHVRALHLNDSRAALGSHVDRHASVGEGQIGLSAFRALVRDPRFADRPGIVETPPDPGGESSFARNIARLKSLRDGEGRVGPGPVRSRAAR